MKHLFVVGAWLVGCASSSAPSPAAPSREGAPSTAALSARYLETFRSAWNATLPTVKPELVAWAKGVDPLVRDPKGPVTVHSESCRSRRQFIQSHIPEIASLVVAGSLDRLDRDGDCGVVEVEGGEKREAEAVLAADGSEVLLMWVVPEG